MNNNYDCIADRGEKYSMDLITRFALLLFLSFFFFVHAIKMFANIMEKMMMIRKHSLKCRRKIQILPPKIFLLRQQPFWLEYAIFIFQSFVPCLLLRFFLLFLSVSKTTDTASALSSFVTMTLALKTKYFERLSV